jgi:hypothetical protein
VSFFSRALVDATNAEVLELLVASGRLPSAWYEQPSRPTAASISSFGIADAEGTADIRCIELLVHGGDIAAGLGLRFEPPPDVCARTVARMFPDPELESLSSRDIAPWTKLRWATGRISIRELPDAGNDWRWHSAPLAHR